MMILFQFLMLWSLVDSQTVPYVSFRGETLPNHGYVDLSLVGNDINDLGNTVRCHTNLQTCCSDNQASHHGYWHFPNGERIANPEDNATQDIIEDHGVQRVDLLRRNNALSPSGIYHCEIPTNDDPSVREKVYVGLYSSGGIHQDYKHRQFNVLSL